MRTTIFRTVCLAVGLLGPVAVSTISGSSPSAVADDGQGHSTGLLARVTMRDATVRTVKLDGVGCTKAICSRTAIKGIGGNASEVREWFDSLSAIRDTNEREATFVSKDRTTRRISLLTDFRVLYLANRLGGEQKLDLARVKSVEFIGAEK